MAKARKQSAENSEKVIRVLGLTEKAFGAKLKATKKGRHSKRHCYLCGVREGEKVVAVDISDREPMFCMPKVSLCQCSREIHGFTFEYDLCFHCGLLLDMWDENGKAIQPRPAIPPLTILDVNRWTAN